MAGYGKRRRKLPIAAYQHCLPNPNPNSLYKHFIFIFIIWCGTRSLRMPALRPASQAGPMRNPREGTSVVLRDTIRLT